MEKRVDNATIYAKTLRWSLIFGIYTIVYLLSPVHWSSIFLFKGRNGLCKKEIL